MSDRIKSWSGQEDAGTKRGACALVEFVMREIMHRNDQTPSSLSGQTGGNVGAWVVYGLGLGLTYARKPA